MWEWAFYLLSLLPMALVALPFIGYARTQRLQAFARDPRLAALGLFFLLYGLASVVQTGGVVAVYIGEGGPPFVEGPVHCLADGPNGTVRCTRGAPLNGTWEAPARPTGGTFQASPNGTGDPSGNGTAEWTGTPGRRVDRLFTVPVQRMWPFWLHHGLVLAALAVASYAYIRPSREQGGDDGAGGGSAGPGGKGGNDGNGGPGGTGGAMTAVLPFALPVAVALPTMVLANAVLQSVEAVLALVPAVLALLNWRSRRTRGSLQVAVGFALLALAHVAFLAVVLVRPLVLVPVFDLLALAGIATLVLAVPRGP